MTPAAGQSLLQYRLAEQIGQGGMGVVWRATDTALGRDAAIKILPDHLSGDAERLARFEREAKLLASLSHPNIAAVYGLHAVDGISFLAMEMVRGEDLAERLKRGPIPVDEALAFASQIADALETAHENGIIHRDLKPANVRVTPGGQIKVLDFGLAKAFDAMATSGSGPSVLQPTVTSLGTVMGVILGTAAYMSPEQARGKPVDRRTDIWAFGCVLYEILTGKRPFDGETVSDSIGRILQTEADLSLLPAETPRGVRELIERCLVKDPRHRMRDIGDARIALERAAMAKPEAGAIHVAAAQAPARAWVPWAGTALAVAVAVGALMFGGRGSATANAPRGPKFVALNAPDGVRFSEQTVDLALAPDGQSIVVAARTDEGTVALYVRRLDDPAWRVLPGTEGAYFPFWSPDGKWVGFFAANKMKKVAVTGGGSESICNAAAGRGGTWSKDGIIVFAPGNFGPLMQVAAGGGPVTEATAIDTAHGEVGHRFPIFLPDGKHFLYGTIPAGDNGHDIYFATLGSKERTLVMSGDGVPSFAPPNRLVFPRGKALYSQTFDPATGRLSDEMRPLVEAGHASGFMASPASSAAAGGVIAFAPLVDVATELDWFSIDGVQGDKVALPDGQYTDVRISPDGTRAVTSRFDQFNPLKGGSEVWLVDLARNGGTRITFDPQYEFAPIWSPDGRSIYYNGNKTGGYLIYRLSAEGAGEPTAVSKPKGLSQQPDDVSPDGRTIVFETQEASTGYDLWLLDTHGDKAPVSYLSSPVNEQQARLSPDGRWLAYLSDENGKNELYVQSFPVAGSKIQISAGGATQAQWDAGGKRLYFMAPGDALMACDIVPGPALKVGPPRKLFQFPRSVFGVDVAPGGKRVLAAMKKSDAEGRTIGLVLDW